MKKIFLFIAALIIFTAEVSASDLYNANLSGWKTVAKNSINGDVYLCAACKHEIMLTIYAKTRSDKKTDPFASFRKNPSQQKNIATHLLRGSIPAELKGVDYEVVKTGMSSLSNVEVFQFSGTVTFTQGVSHHSMMIGNTPNSAFSIIINYYDGDMNSVARKALNEVLSSIKFK